MLATVDCCSGNPQHNPAPSVSPAHSWTHLKMTVLELKSIRGPRESLERQLTVLYIVLLIIYHIFSFCDKLFFLEHLFKLYYFLFLCLLFLAYWCSSSPSSSSETMNTRFEYLDIRVLISSKSMDQIKYLIIFTARLIFTFKMTAPQAEG